MEVPFLCGRQDRVGRRWMAIESGRRWALDGAAEVAFVAMASHKTDQGILESWPVLVVELLLSRENGNARRMRHRGKMEFSESLLLVCS
jgi:hypothetical protein